MGLQSRIKSMKRVIFAAASRDGWQRVMKKNHFFLDNDFFENYTFV